jgi:hypothetical protein
MQTIQQAIFNLGRKNFELNLETRFLSVESRDDATDQNKLVQSERQLIQTDNALRSKD